MALSGLPLTMYGKNVGTARINDDGTIDLIMESPCQFGLDIIKEMEAGQHAGLTLMPTGSPAVPFMPSTEG